MKYIKLILSIILIIIVLTNCNRPKYYIYRDESGKEVKWYGEDTTWTGRYPINDSVYITEVKIKI